MNNIVKLVVVSFTLFSSAILSAKTDLLETESTSAYEVLVPTSNYNPFTWFKRQCVQHPKRTAAIAVGGVAAAAVGYKLFSEDPLQNFTKEDLEFAGKAKALVQATDKKLPIVYHKDYNISLAGVEKLHSFDSQKYRRVYNHLVTTVGIKPERFHTPTMATQDDLLKVHTSAYLDSLNSSAAVAKIVYLPQLNYLPHFVLRRNLLEPMKLATSGTVLATELALQEGWAINLGGGYHHAKATEGSGGCAFSDIALAIHWVHELHPNYKILVVDLDAHQGNGVEMICGPDKRVSIFDVYNEDMYPQDKAAKKYIDFNHPVKSGIKDKAYLKILADHLPAAIAASKPDLIVYNAGTDIYEKDPLGRMSVSEAGIIERDEFVFRCALDEKIPVVMILSGGYTKESHSIISKSITNILQMVLKP